MFTIVIIIILYTSIIVTLMCELAGFLKYFHSNCKPTSVVVGCLFLPMFMI